MAKNIFFDNILDKNRLFEWVLFVCFDEIAFEFLNFLIMTIDKFVN